jgi:predicted amidohydrolase YtcJ
MKLLFNARIHTQAVPRIAAAVLIDGERVVAVGDADGLRTLAGGRLQERDMRGRVILPGLTDAHLHFKSYSLNLQKVDCETRTREDCLGRVAERARAARPGEWVLGHGWNQNEWGGWPAAADLDRAAPDNPVYLTAKSLHAAWVNSAALKQAGVSAATPDPENGVIQRDSAGRPTGILLEAAMNAVSDRLPPVDVATVARAMEQAQPLLWRMGLTGVHDFDRREAFMALQSLHAQGRLKLRVTKNIPVESLEDAARIGLRTGFGDDWLRIGSVKAFMDGALGPRTAAMFQPYAGEPENRGILNMDGEGLFEHARLAADTGLGMTVHAIGDRAVHEVLDAYEQLRAYESQQGLPALRHRIEHVQVVHPDDAARLARLQVVASMQPIHATSDMPVAERYWGERCALAYAWRTQLDRGATLAFGSDAPVESPNPFWGLHAAVTRRRADGSPGAAGWHPEQRLTFSEALAAYTIGPAFAAYMEDRLGRLAPGHLADMIVLEQDPFACDPADLPALAAAATMIGGEWVWDAL